MSLKYKVRVAAPQVTDETKYDIIRRPIITEKATILSAYGQYVFEVAVDATKPQIRQAVESIFNVKVTSVNTLNQDGKVVRFRGRKGRRPNYKKAMITLQEGQTIDVQTGI